jgi:hypothetical protein
MSETTRIGDVQLYVVYLGGDPLPGRLGEDHEVVMVVASNVKEARRAARAKWQGDSAAHVDAVQVLNVVDGFAIRLEPTDRVDTNAIDVTYEPDGSAEVS